MLVDAAIVSPNSTLETMLLLSRVGMNYLDTCMPSWWPWLAVGRPHVRDDQNSSRC